MIRKLLTSVITILFLIGLSFGITYFTHTKFIDYSCFIGLAATAVIWYFTSKGDGFSSRRLDMSIQGSTGIRLEEKKFEFSPNIVFLTCVAYTIITTAALLFHYRSYF